MNIHVCPKCNSNDTTQIERRWPTDDLDTTLFFIKCFNCGYNEEIDG